MMKLWAAKPTVAALAERYAKEFKLSTNQLAQIGVIQRAPIGAKVAEKLTLNDYREHAVLRKNNEVQTFVRRKDRPKQLTGATVGKDFGLLSVIFTHAKDYWDVPIDLELLKQARRKLKKEKLIARRRSARAGRRVTSSRDCSPMLHRAERQQAHEDGYGDVTSFPTKLGRRISETCRIQRKDVNLEKQTYWVYNLKNPNGKGVHHEFVLFGAHALEIVREERLAVIPDHPDARLFPFNSRTCSARYTAAKKRARHR
jgi:integrase